MANGVFAVCLGKPFNVLASVVLRVAEHVESFVRLPLRPLAAESLAGFRYVAPWWPKVLATFATAAFFGGCIAPSAKRFTGIHADPAALFPRQLLPPIRPQPKC